MKKLFYLSFLTIGISTTAFSQSMSFSLTLDSVVKGAPGAGEIVVNGEIHNLTALAFDVDADRLENNLATGAWTAWFCTDECQSPSDDYDQTNVPAGASREFSYHFISDVAADTSDGLMRFTEIGPGGAVIYQRFVGITIDGFVSVQTQTLPNDKASVYPSALSSSQTLNVLIPRDIFCYESANHFEVFDMSGKKVYETTLVEGEFHQISVSDWGKGVFLYKVSGSATARSQVGRIVIY